MHGKYTFINRADVPVVLQREPQECGAAALAMIFAFYGKYAPWQELLDETILEQGGCNAAGLLRSAKKRGFDAHGYKKEVADLRGMEMPCILHWSDNNFVVLEGFEGDLAYIIDPSCGRTVFTLEEAAAAFTGVTLVIRPGKE